MATIEQAVKSNLARVPGAGNELAPTVVSVTGPPLSGLPAMRTVLPSRGTYPPDIILDTDFEDAVDMPRGQMRSRILLTRLLLAKRKNKVSPATSTVVNVPSGTPLQVTGLTATEVPTKLNGQMVAVVTVTWTPGVGDAFYSYAQVWVTGYHGVKGAQLVASGPSPLTFSLDATNETVTVSAVAVSASGVKASTAGAPALQLVLSPTSGTPPAPVVTQNLVAVTGGGYQFTFSFDTGLLGNIIQAYNVYRNTTNSFSGATLVRAVPQPQTNTGSFVFQDFSTLDPVTTQYYYFVTAVDVNGNESAATSAQGATVFSIVSTGLNGQASTTPNATPSSIFVLSQQAATDGSAAAGMNATWAATNPAAYRPDGTTLAAPASSALPVLTAPVLGQQAGGARAARTVYVRLALVKAGCILSVSNETSLAVSANNVLTVVSPTNPGRYDGWLPMYSLTSTQEAVPTDLNAANSSGKQAPVAFGTGYTQPNTGAEPQDKTLGFFLGGSSAGPSLVTSGTGAGWTTPNNVTLDDGTSFATELITAGVTTAALQGTFGVATRVPANAVITGIKVALKRKSSSNVAPGLETSSVNLLGVAGSVAKTSLVDWGTTLTQEVYGSAGDLWGLTVITPAQVNAAGFGFQAQVTNNDTVSRTASVDAFVVTISYSLGGLTGIYTGNLATATTYSLYLAYDTAIGTFLAANGNANGGGDAAAAATQVVDGRFQVNAGKFTFTTPAALVGGNSSTSTGGGGRQV